MAKILSVSVKAGTARLLDPLGRALLRAGISANMVTIVGTIGVLAGAYLAAIGHLVWAVVVVTLSALTDVMDGSMARNSGTTSRFGALLDSAMDRVADGAVFAALAIYYRDEV